jgi:hypothetical protein
VWAGGAIRFGDVGIEPVVVAGGVIDGARKRSSGPKLGKLEGARPPDASFPHVARLVAPRARCSSPWLRRDGASRRSDLRVVLGCSSAVETAAGRSIPECGLSVHTTLANCDHGTVQVPRVTRQQEEATAWT